MTLGRRLLFFKDNRICVLFLSRRRYIYRSMLPETMNQNRYLSSDPASRLFASNKITKKYAEFRPIYPPQTYEIITDFTRERYPSAEFDLAVDVGCGSGQSSVPLTTYFAKVIGVDVSESQIAQAPTNIPNLSFRCSSTNNLGFIENESVNLITVAQAFHWFDKEKFFEEAHRILKPFGSLVIYGYGNFDLDNKDAQAYKHQIYTDVLGKYWNKERELIDSKYASIALPYAGWRRCDELVMEKVWTVHQLVGYISSWSAVNKLLSENPKSTFLEDISSEFLKFYGKSDQSADSVEVKISWPIFMLLGHKPLKY